ncbi:sensor histidine kinase [Streptomyces mexicanus]|uniref:sensor histidine kinase n=1 Tax=Streptomyces mexicanus TaxID=178566 RepID=UPI001357828C|nr:nitrate- and nitrite sensing domain-containing protein [Streptomyces mexicanus]
MPGTRDRRTRHRAALPRSLRSSFVLPFVIPAVCVSGLWGYTAAGLVDEQVRLHTDAGHVSSLARPAQELLTRLQDERRLTARWQADRTGTSRTELEAARRKTDAALAAYRRHASGPDTDTLRRRAAALEAALRPLAERRSHIDARTLSSADAFAYYTDTASQGLALLSAAVRSDDAELGRGGTAALALARITEMLSREDALVSAALPAHRIAEADRARFGQYAALRQAAQEELTARDLPGAARTAYGRITGGAQWAAVDAVEQAVGGGQGTALPQRAAQWPAAADSVVSGLRSAGSQSLDAVADRASDHAGELLTTTLLGTAAALAALAAAAVLALRARRSTLDRLAELDALTARLADLRAGAEQVASFRLAEILSRAERGERVDPAVLAPWRQQASDDIGRLASAIDRMAQIATDSAVRQSQGRQGSDKVVGQLIRRAQVLIHRLIALLDDLERKHEDSDLLKDIFRIDHLATRVRRHAENLMILSGAPPSRRMTRPVAITDVMRGAVAETEQYTRVRVKNTPADRRISLAGRAVADVTHLLAELIENGTSFSPPETQVTVSASRVAKGLAVHIEDQGLGMPPELLQRANELLADPPRVDMTVFGEDPRLGHFVVARLAERHGIKVVLRESDYGGTLALVGLPKELLEESGSPVVDQLQSAAVAAGRAVEGPSGVALSDTGRHRALAGPAVPAAAGAPAPAGEEVITHTSLPDPSGFPEYGGAGLLPPASEHPAPSAPQGPPPAARTIRDIPSAGPVRAQSPGAAPDRTVPGGTGGQPPLPPRDSRPAPARQPDRSPEWSRGADAEPPGPSGPVGGAPAPRPLTTPSVLPQRVRGASLAQQLRKEAAQAADDGDDGSDDVISPDASARTMSAIHQGLKRAWRSEDDDTPHGAHGRPSDGAGPTAHEL